jgi:hypothetical protein
MGLEPIRRGENGYALINDNKVPFAKMWSPSLVPKPKDWGPHVSIPVMKVPVRKVIRSINVNRISSSRPINSAVSTAVVRCVIVIARIAVLAV